MQFGDEPSFGAFDLNSDFVGFNVSDCLVEVDPLPLLLDEVSDGAFVDGVGQERKGNRLLYMDVSVLAKRYRLKVVRVVARRRKGMAASDPSRNINFK